jgi:uncharacterized membrane protein
VTSDLQTIARGDASRLLQSRRVVARNDAEWRALWASHAGQTAVAPPVDFATRMVAAVFQGQRSSAGFETTIVDARVDRDVLAIEVDERPPARGRAVAHVLVSPFHIISLPRFDGEVRFDDVYQHANEVTQAGPVSNRSEATAPLPSLSSSTGLAPETAGALAYLAGPFSGALLLIMERTSRYVRFHAWQALIGLGALGLAAFLCLGLAFAMLIVSPRGFAVLRWMAGVGAVAWVVFWGIGLAQALKGKWWKMPVAGEYADRLAGK